MKEKKNKLCRREAVSTLLNMRDDSLVVTGLGGTCWDVTAVGDTPLNFPMWGGMGGAAIGVGHVVGNYLSGALRNPSAAAGQTATMFIGIAFSEALGIFSFLVALLLMFAV